MKALPHITIIILNWNGRSYLNACLSALENLDYPDFDILLVDNNSSDDSVSFVEQAFPGVQILRNQRNWGYAGGNNRALRRIQSDFAVLVNPDIVVSRSWLKELIAPMLADSAIGVAGCKLYFPGGNLLQHAGGLIHKPRAMPAHRAGGQIDQGQFNTLEDVDYVTGAAVALKRETWKTIGLLDEGFFMYFEEADYCARARAAGFRVVYVPAAAAVHDESAFAVRGSPTYLERFHTGRWRYLLKHFDPQEILAHTFPAEKGWLKTLPGTERWAVNRAYRATLAGLTEILQARVTGGQGVINAEQQKAMAIGLAELRLAAFNNPEYVQKLAEMGAKGSLLIEPFTSSVPLFGPLIAGLRSLWASVAVREGAANFVEQQSAFNQRFIQALSQKEKNLPLPRETWLEKDNNLGTVKQRQKEIDAQLVRMVHLLNSIQERLERLEKITKENLPE